MVSYGEGWHNYHHVFPWDYKTSELGDYRYNFSTAFIDFFAKIGMFVVPCIINSVRKITCDDTPLTCNAFTFFSYRPD